MASDLDGEVARTMEVDPRLLPVLPELVADLRELGSSADSVVTALRAVGLRPGSAVLDLGCGKGAVAVALAEELDVAVLGVDAFPPFLASARALAAERGVAAKCDFRDGDARALLAGSGRFDAVLLLSLGPVLGDHVHTVAGLRRLVRPGGWIVVEDGYLADGTSPPPGYEGCGGRTETLRDLTSAGDVLVHETVFTARETRALNERNTELIRRRALALRAERPELAGPLDEYVARQEHETEVLGDAVPCALWVLRRR